MSLQQQGAPMFQTVQASPSNGFTGTIQLTFSALPAGVSGTPAGPYSVSINSSNAQSIAVQLGASQAATIGTTTVTATGTSGAIVHTAKFSVSVTQAAPWTIQASPPSISLTPGTGTTVTLSVTSTAPTAPQLGVQLPDTSGLSGINITAPQGFLTPTNPLTFIVNPTPQAQPVQNYPFVLTASDSSGNTEVLTLPLTVTVPFSANTTATRSTFARTDQSPTGMVYDQTRKLLFASVEILDEVVVLSTVDGSQVASIPVGFPAGIDESADGSAVYVVSPFFSGITVIDPGLLQVVGHVNVPASVSGQPVGSAFFQVATLSDGTVLLLESGGANGILRWTPATNDFTIFGSGILLSVAGLISRSADHTKVIAFGGDSGGILYDVGSGTFTGPNSGITAYTAISPNGSQIMSVGIQNSPTVFYDANLNQIASIQLDAFPITGVAYSLNGNYAYVLTSQNNNGGNIAAVINTTTFSVAGLIPGFSFGASLPFSGQWITTFAEDETGMLFGAAVGGVGFLDMTTPTSLSVPLPQSFVLQPTLASLAGPTSAQIDGAGFTQNLTFNLFLGAPPASPQSLKASSVSVQSTNFASTTIPQGATAGPANVTLTRSDGFYAVMPDGITFGPTVLRVDADAGSNSGGDTIKIVGYGFDAGNPSVTIGGRPAAISLISDAIQDQLFPTETMTVTTPPGSPGNADVVVSTSSGSTTLADGFQYLNSAQVYPKAGALEAIAYDQARQRLYVTNQQPNELEIFDLTSNTYLPPIALGNGPLGLALTPDGTLLGVLNSTDGTVSVVDPVGMKVKATYTVLTASDTACGGLAFGITAAEPHRMMIDINCTDDLSAGVFHLVNLDTGSLSCTGVAGCATNGTDFNIVGGLAPVASTVNGSELFFASAGPGGPVAILNLTANTLQSAPSDGGFSDCAVDSDKTIFAANFALWNPQPSLIGVTAIEAHVDAGSQSFNTVIGEKLNPAGSLLFVPQLSGVDVFDVHTGRLALHVAVPDPVLANTNAMALDETGTKMFLTSSTGVTVAQLSQVPLSIATVNPSQGASGTTFTLRGSGFLAGAVATLGTTQASTTFVDANTLTVTVPSISAGVVRITVANPGGQTYAFDDAFDVE